MLFVYLYSAIGRWHCNHFIIVVDSVFIDQSLRGVDIPQCWLELAPYHDKLLDEFHFIALQVWLFEAAHRSVLLVHPERNVSIADV